MTTARDFRAGDFVRVGTGRITWRVESNTATDEVFAGLSLTPSVVLVEVYGEAREVGPFSRTRLVFGADKVAALVKA